MKSLLMFFGYTAYQAGCIAPMMWFFVIGAVVDTIKNTISSWNIKLEEARKTFEEADKAFKASSNKVAA